MGSGVMGARRRRRVVAGLVGLLALLGSGSPDSMSWRHGAPRAGGATDAAPPYPVGLAASDDPVLTRPVPRDRTLDDAALLELVRRAVDLAGGMGSVVPDTARLVVLKPNIAIAYPPQTGVVTDPRVVGAVALLVHEVAPHARILIGEGPGGWQGPPPPGTRAVEFRHDVRPVDGFALSGFRDLVAGLQVRGLDVACFDLNYDESRPLAVPGGGLAAPEYSLPAAILSADAWINCSVAKTHGPRITASLKNQIGLLPGMVYGWPKMNGTPDHPGMPHEHHQIDEVLVDLLALSQPDLNVVEAIVAREGGALWRGEPRRCNWVLAGRNAVATDLVAARLMGFNPDDMEFAELAAQARLGPRHLEEVEVRGTPVEQLAARFKKAVEAYDPGEPWRILAGYGMGPRYWTLLGPLPAGHRMRPPEVARLAPVPGQDGWSAVTWFGHDEIDLRGQFGLQSPGVVYAFTRFTMARSDSVRLWAGSDEGLEVWIDGVPVYGHEGARHHELGQDRLPAYVPAGEHRLLVRAVQTRGPFAFSVNICEPLDDPRYAGNRYPGVRYYVERAAER
ncbi:MAG: DUF362 domain-containing protein [Candidatus Latescibacterota bacterium]